MEWISEDDLIDLRLDELEEIDMSELDKACNFLIRNKIKPNMD